MKSDQTALSLTDFADDQAVKSSSSEGAAKIVGLVKDHFREIGLDIKPSKSTAILIKDSRRVSSELSVNGDKKIKFLSEGEHVK